MKSVGYIANILFSWEGLWLEVFTSTAFLIFNQIADSSNILQSLRISMGWDDERLASPSMCREVSEKLNCDILGWCGLGNNNTLCLCSLLLLRGSKGFPDIISLFLIITPWHTWHQWVKCFFPQPSGGRVRTRTQVSRLLALQPPHCTMQLSGSVTCLTGKGQFTVTVVRVRDLLGRRGRKDSSLLLQAYEVDDP